MLLSPAQPWPPDNMAQNCTCCMCCPLCLALYPGLAVEPAANGDARLAAARSRLNATAGRVLERYDVHVHIVQRVGRAHTRIGEYANEVDADLVVACVRGEDSLLSLMLNSPNRQRSHFYER